jgi:uncharacterized transporter YbjL
MFFLILKQTNIYPNYTLEIRNRYLIPFALTIKSNFEYVSLILFISAVGIINSQGFFHNHWTNLE